MTKFKRYSEWVSFRSRTAVLPLSKRQVPVRLPCPKNDTSITAPQALNRRHQGLQTDLEASRSLLFQRYPGRAAAPDGG